MKETNLKQYWIKLQLLNPEIWFNGRNSNNCLKNDYFDKFRKRQRKNSDVTCFQKNPVADLTKFKGFKSKLFPIIFQKIPTQVSCILNAVKLLRWIFLRK